MARSRAAPRAPAASSPSRDPASPRRRHRPSIAPLRASPEPADDHAAIAAPETKRIAQYHARLAGTTAPQVIDAAAMIELSAIEACRHDSVRNGERADRDLKCTGRTER